MSGIQQMLLAAVSGIVRNFTAWNVSGDSTPGVNASASLTFNPNGAVSHNAITNDNSVAGSSSWHFPNVANIGVNYYIKFTPTVGTLTTNDAAAFTVLSAARSVSKSGTTGTASCTFTVQIATDAAGTNIVFTSTGNVVGYTHT